MVGFSVGLGNPYSSNRFSCCGGVTAPVAGIVTLVRVSPCRLPICKVFVVVEPATVLVAFKVDPRLGV